MFTIVLNSVTKNVIAIAVTMWVGLGYVNTNMNTNMTASTKGGWVGHKNK